MSWKTGTPEGVRDGKVWCEACRQTFPTQNDFHKHRPGCQHDHRLPVELTS